MFYLGILSSTFFLQPGLLVLSVAWISDAVKERQAFIKL